MEIIQSILIAFMLSSQLQTVFCNLVENITDGEAFDFVIVGAGAAGCTAARRLAENGKYSVLLIEAGGHPHPDLDVPGISWRFLISGDPKYIKRYPTVPQQNAGLARNGIINYVIGRTLGGSTAINVMTVNRGNPHDYNLWANITGDESWNYANMLHYLKKLENYSGDFPSDQRGFDGPISVSRSYLYNPGLEEWLQGGRELSYKIVDPNGPQVVSFGYKDFSRKQGRRVSSFKGYIEPLLLKSDSKVLLTVLIHTEVNQILFEGKRAVGVTFNKGSTGNEGFVRAKKEVIITAGIIDTTAILLRSGIGPKSILEKENIPVINHLPVGENLHDHPIIGIPIIFGNKSAAMDVNTDLNSEAWMQYEETGEGPYSSFLGSSGQAFLVTENLPEHEKVMGWVNVLLSALNGNGFGQLIGGMPIKDLKDSEIAVTWSSILGRPKSRGSITLDSNKNPLIDFKYLSHRDDMKSILEGIKTILRLCETTQALKTIGCRIPNDTLPACSHLPFRSDSYWECYTRQLSTTNYHAVGTCRFGQPNDPNTVVDLQLRVIGTLGLRVLDSSVIPVVTDSNTQVPVYAIAEKASDMILKFWDESSNIGHAEIMTQ